MKKIYSLILVFTGTICLNAQIISTVAGNGTPGFSGDGGQATSAQIGSAVGMAVDPNGVMYISDGNHRIRKVDVNGVITTFAGTGTMGFSGDNMAATSAQLNTPAGLAFNSAGDLFIADYQNHRIRKITMSTGIITTVAGSIGMGFSGDGGAATSAQLSSPTGVCWEAKDNMVIADQGNARVRRVDHISGDIATVAGSGSPGHSGDGGVATSAAIGNVYDVKCDLNGNIIFSEVTNHYIRKVNMGSGTITSICGSGVATFFGDGGLATAASVSAPEGICIDGGGNIFIAELNNDRIRKIDAITGIITTVAGNGMYAYSGDGGPATSAGMWPDYVAVSGTDLYIVDLNNRIRKVTNVAVVGIEQLQMNHSAITLFPNPTIDYFTINGIADHSQISIYDVSGNLISSEIINENEPVDIRDLAPGIYFMLSGQKQFRIIKL
ncbi:hypothetical protein BH09BAC5_BH09BAC5_15580 [soil metagenome]